MEFKGTKGKWKVGDDREVCSGKGQIICYTVNSFGTGVSSQYITEEQAEANAKLIAESKELLELALLVHRITDRKQMPTEMEVKVLREQSEKVINKVLN